MNLSKTDKTDSITQAFIKLQESCEEALYKHCDKCNISYPSDHVFLVPSLDKNAMEYLGHTPNTMPQLLESLSQFCGLLEKKDLTKASWQNLCQWPSSPVEACVVLLSHAFHCPQVQCMFIPELLVEQGSSLEVKLDDDIKTVLAITHKEKHYALLKVDLDDRKVLIWDTARKKKPQHCKALEGACCVCYQITLAK
jgi:hypothetical protein